MGRNSRYEEQVLPRLEEIREWVGIIGEREIAKKLGIASSTFQKYKKEYPELKEALRKGRETLVEDLKTSLKMKAKGFSYTEKKSVTKTEDGVTTTVVEEYQKFSPPDTGAIHLLLKNLDPAWRNDDRETMDLKQKKLELEQKKAEAEDW